MMERLASQVAVVTGAIAPRYGRIITLGSRLALKGSATMAHHCAANSRDERRDLR
jgi:hypothetical protein